jgi:hypothetical protein
MLPRMHTAPLTGSAAELSEKDLDEVPGCEARPNEFSSSQCGDPASVLALCVIEHAHHCQQHYIDRFCIWLCEYHLQRTREGCLRCVPCTAIAVIQQLL